MRRRLISVGSLLVAVFALGVVLYNATLVDRRPPGIARVSLSAPAGSDPRRAQPLTAIDIVFSEPVRTSTVERRFRIVPYVAGTLTWDGTMAIFTPSAKLPAGAAFQVFVDSGFEDVEGNAATTGLDAWAFETVGPPAILAATPPDGSDGVPVEGALTIEFDRYMDTRSVESAIRVEPATTIRPSWSGQTLTLGFDPRLLFGTTYAVTIGTTAADTGGNRLQSALTTHFTTVAAGLRVSTTIPADGVSGISVRTAIAIVFDGTIDPASTADAIRITPSVAGDVRIAALPADSTPGATPSATEPTGQVLLFVPSAPLAPHTTYTVTLASVVARPGAPSQVAAGKTWTFTTGQPTVSAQNQIAFLSSRGGVANLWLMNPDGSNPRQLTTEIVPVVGFDVTADGSRVAWSAGGVARTMRIDGTDGRTVTGDGRFEYGPRFTPDGRSLLVGRRGGDGTDVGYWLVPVAEGAPAERQVLQTGAPVLGSSLVSGDALSRDAGTPVWSSRAAFDPAGRHVLVTTGTGAVALVDLQPTDPELAIADTGIVAGGAPAWSAPAGQFVVVGRRGAEASDSLYVVGIEGGVTQRVAADGSAAASPDGAVAVLHRDAAGISHVAVARATSSGAPRALTDATDTSDRWPAFSPDGKSVLFGRVRTDNPDVSAGIWVVDPATGKLAALSSDGAYPRWLP